MCFDPYKYALFKSKYYNKLQYYFIIDGKKFSPKCLNSEILWRYMYSFYYSLLMSSIMTIDQFDYNQIIVQTDSKLYWLSVDCSCAVDSFSMHIAEN